MKKILIILSLILTPIVFSQVVSVSISETYLSLKSGNLNYLSVLKDPDSTSVGITNLKYVLDLNKKTSTVYMDGFKINTLNFNTVEKNNNVYVITIKDKNIYDGTLLMTKFTLDTSKNLLVYQWYDKYYDLTIVLTFKQKIVISN
jgi:predicted transcriptional regulator